MATRGVDAFGECSPLAVAADQVDQVRVRGAHLDVAGRGVGLRYAQSMSDRIRDGNTVGCRFPKQFRTATLQSGVGSQIQKHSRLKIFWISVQVRLRIVMSSVAMFWATRRSISASAGVSGLGWSRLQL